MDGNRRWATEHGRSAIEGHQAGFATFKAIVAAVGEAGIPHAVFYAFSTENWQRGAEEVTGLLTLFEHALYDESQKESAPGTSPRSLRARVRFVGRRSDFSEELQALMKRFEGRSVPEAVTTIWVALSYGGRAEIMAAVNDAIAAGMPVDETSFRAHLWGAEMPDIDLLVRTSGEQRLSNFFPWHTVYSELHFTPTYWPAFTKEEFTRILEEYATRKRRRGA